MGAAVVTTDSPQNELVEVPGASAAPPRSKSDPSAVTSGRSVRSISGSVTVRSDSARCDGSSGPRSSPRSSPRSITGPGTLSGGYQLPSLACHQPAAGVAATLSPTASAPT